MLVSFDYESAAIAPRPDFPPKPAGLAIYIDGKDPYYMAFGHPTMNNSTEDYARDVLSRLFDDPSNEFIAHNLPFDASIAEEKWGLVVPWDQCHDTMLLAFLLDPFGELSLKPLAELHLGEPPTEQDDVKNWLVRHGVCRANDKRWGAHIAKAPGDVVAPYAIGDVRKTMNLYKKFKEKIDAKSNSVG